MWWLLLACGTSEPTAAVPTDEGTVDEGDASAPLLSGPVDPCAAPAGPWRLEIVVDGQAVRCEPCGLRQTVAWWGDGVVGSGVGPVLWPQARRDGAATCAVGPARRSTTLTGSEALERVSLEAWDDEDLLGLAVGTGADFDGDGAMDLVLGAPYADALYWAEGAAVVVPGAALGTGEVLALESAGRLTGSASADFLGWQVGSLVVDGEPLVLVGAPGDERVGENAGAVALLPAPGAGERPELTDLEHTWLSPVADAWFGVALAVADVDGDGVDEVIAGGYGADDDRGAAWVLAPGADPEPLLQGGTSGELAGLAVARVGDLDGDGMDEIAVGAPAVGSPLTPWVAVWNQGAIERFEGELDSHLGYAVVGLGDRDGDGLDDWAVSAPGADDVVVHTGGGEEVVAATAHALAGPGDLDGDGLAELVLGEGRALDRVTIVLADRSTVIHQGDELSFFGWSVAGAGDLDGDGLSEILVGRPGWDEPDTEAGGAVLLTRPLSP